MKPPGINKDSWDDLDVWSQAKMLAYCQTRDYDENPPVKTPKLPAKKR